MATDTASYTATAGADIDADTDPQTWGYKKGPNIPGAEDHGATGGLCFEANLAIEVVGPCAPEFGQSVF